MCQEKRLIESGKHDDRKIQRRRREQVVRELPNNISNVHSYKIKYTERISESKRRSYSDEDKKNWEKVLTPELAISSDESGTEDGKGVIFCEKYPGEAQN